MKIQDNEIGIGTARINDETSFDINGVYIAPRAFNIHLKGSEAITIYTFNSLMFPIEQKRKGTDVYEFKGPCIGLYYDVADIREGPYINHFIDKLLLSIKYQGKSATFHLKGQADMSKSSFDDFWYKGLTNGIWTFEVRFIHYFNES
ncbi:MAG: hypothetical protein PHW18_06705 [Sulfuricurvum sp.]|uniref:hypothetical protein n=1 Tax=Sulfuricurvum sp. TaxID=2025608 RepID=UPI0026300B70|nr:hypothetical protein [Sulfuricurvum sp.]MDD2829248.1 hypothetical protein [Sulfuricurvum sp.]MDD4949988.1 hypothetical protein [Sulfuricurvum sp.]